MTSREEEMAKLKARYAQTRGNKVDAATPTKKEPVKTAPRKIYGKSAVEKVKDFVTPYLHIIENDFRRALGLKSIEELEKETKFDPLLAAWKRGRNL